MKKLVFLTVMIIAALAMVAFQSISIAGAYNESDQPAAAPEEQLIINNIYNPPGRQNNNNMPVRHLTPQNNSAKNGYRIKLEIFGVNNEQSANPIVDIMRALNALIKRPDNDTDNPGMGIGQNILPAPQSPDTQSPNLSKSPNINNNSGNQSLNKAQTNDQNDNLNKNPNNNLSNQRNTQNNSQNNQNNIQNRAPITNPQNNNSANRSARQNDNAPQEHLDISGNGTNPTHPSDTKPIKVLPLGLSEISTDYPPAFSGLPVRL